MKIQNILAMEPFQEKHHESFRAQSKHFNPSSIMCCLRSSYHGSFGNQVKKIYFHSHDGSWNFFTIDLARLFFCCCQNSFKLNYLNSCICSLWPQFDENPYFFFSSFVKILTFFFFTIMQTLSFPSCTVMIWKWLLRRSQTLCYCIL